MNERVAIANRRPRNVRSPVGTEFAPPLVACVLATPGALAAILSDDLGHAIDFAHDPGEIDIIDVQLLGAQIGQTMFRIEQGSTPSLQAGAIVIVEAQKGCFIAGVVSRTYVIALSLAVRANVGAAMSSIAHARVRLQRELP